MGATHSLALCQVRTVASGCPSTHKVGCGGKDEQYLELVQDTDEHVFKHDGWLDTNPARAKLAPGAGGAPEPTDELEAPGLSHLFEMDLPELQELGAQPPQPEAGSAAPVHFRSGATYVGQWRGHARHGFGVQRWPDGTRYEGQWVNSSAEGRGRITFADGDVYTGEWRANAFNGLGAYRGHDGTVFLGRWVSDRREGAGFEISGGEQRDVTYAGHFRAGRKEGPGVCYWPDGGQYKGEWKADRITGKGVHSSAGGITASGEWLDGTMIRSCPRVAEEQAPLPDPCSTPKAWRKRISWGPTEEVLME